MFEKLSSKLKDIILGGQDGLVNVLGLVLGVAGATNDTRIILISGLAGTFAESISMGAVAYTSSKAARDYYLSEHEKNSKNKKIIKTISEKLHVCPEEYSNPLMNGFIVGFSAIIGSLIPLIPFIVMSVRNGIYSSITISFFVLFFIGAIKAKLTIGDWKRSGLEMGLIGIAAAIVGYLIGILLGAIPL